MQVISSNQIYLPYRRFKIYIPHSFESIHYSISHYYLNAIIDVTIVYIQSTITSFITHYYKMSSSHYRSCNRDRMDSLIKGNYKNLLPNQIARMRRNIHPALCYNIWLAYLIKTNGMHYEY